MPAGRPQIADPKKLYWFALHFYWEMKSLLEPPVRIVVDRDKEERLLSEFEESSPLNPKALAELAGDVDRQIQRGWLAEERREERLRELKEAIEYHRRFSGANAARQLSEREVKIPAEPEIIDALLNATSAERIAEICSEAFCPVIETTMTGEVVRVLRPNWPISDASLLPSSLTQHAVQFLEAKSDPRFPASGRPTSRAKQLWFLSRALAGAVNGISTRTAINLLGSVRPDENNDVVRLSKRTRKPSKLVKLKKS